MKTGTLGTGREKGRKKPRAGLNVICPRGRRAGSRAELPPREEADEGRSAA